jgi:hypothetical protein
MNNINEHDITKMMLSKLHKNHLITEVISKDTDDAIKVSDDDISDEVSKLSDIVGGVDLKLYEVYPRDKNVIMVGVLDNGIEFKFSKKELEPYINVDNLRLDDATVDIIKGLRSYYVNWVDTWVKKFISEYN